VIERVNYVKLLGVPLQNDLKWNLHLTQIEEITNKSNKLLFHVRECRKTNLSFGLSFYETKIRPILEYASAIRRGLRQYLNDEITEVHPSCQKIKGTFTISGFAKCCQLTIECHHWNVDSVFLKYNLIKAESAGFGPINRCSVNVP
jgi:hypothetical protein